MCVFEHRQRSVNFDCHIYTRRSNQHLAVLFCSPAFLSNLFGDSCASPLIGSLGSWVTGLSDSFGRLVIGLLGD